MVGLLTCTTLLAQTPTQTIRGQVQDKASKQVLQGASVMLDNTNLGAISDEQGHFRIINVKPGRYILTVSFVGYDKLVLSDVLVNASKEIVLEINLQENVQKLSELTVVPSRTGQVSPVSSHSFNIEEVQRFAANYYDPARLVTSFAGVATTNDQANNIVIRGNSPNGLLWRLEGIDIVNPNHLTNAGTFSDRPMQNGGGVNILSTQLLANSTFLTGAFPANYGNALSGVMDMSLRKGNNEQHEITAQASVIGVDVAMEGPFSKKSKASFLANYRYSFTGLLGAMGVKLGDEDIAFQDLSFNLSFPTLKSGTFTLFGMGGTSSNVFTAERDRSLWKFEKDNTDIEYTARMGAIGLTHEVSLSSKTSWRTVMALSAREDNRKQDFLGNDYTPTNYIDESFQNRRLSISTAFTHKFAARNYLKIGTFVNATRNTQLTATATSSGSNITERTIVQPYADWHIGLSEQLKAQVGLHSTGFATLEPRAALTWSGLANQSLSLAYGLHTQAIRRGVLTTYLPGSTSEKNLNLTKAHHYVLSFRQRLHNKINLNIETYYQSLLNVPISATRLSSYSALNELEINTKELLVAKGKGKNYGVEVSAEQVLTQNYYYLFTASLYQSKYQGSDGIWRDSRFNGKYIFTFTGGKEIALTRKQKDRTLGINVRGIWQGGYRDTPINTVASQVARTTVYKENEAFTQKLDDYVRLDLRISLKKNKNNYTRTLALDIQNVLNKENAAYQYYDVLQNQLVSKTQLGLVPIISYRVEF